MEEIFKTIEDYPSYEVSNLGRIKSLKSNNIRYLKPSLDFDGYRRVTLSDHGKQATKKVHQLIAIAFLNHKTCGSKLIVDHIDNDKLNNRVDNLQIITTRLNTSKDQKRDLPTGVYRTPNGRFRTQIRVNGKSTHLGTHNTIEEASNAYQLKLKELC